MFISCSSCADLVLISCSSCARLVLILCSSCVQGSVVKKGEGRSWKKCPSTFPSSHISTLSCICSELTSGISVHTAVIDPMIHACTHTQAITKQFAELLHFTLSFDDLKVRDHVSVTLYYTVSKCWFYSWVSCDATHYTLHQNCDAP